MSQEAIAELVLNGVLRAAIHIANTLHRAARRSQLGQVDPGQGSALPPAVARRHLEESGMRGRIRVAEDQEVHTGGMKALAKRQARTGV